MKKRTTILIILIAAIVIAAIACVSAYNSLVTARENVDTQFAAIETQLQRRNDLIPNVVNTVKGYASHESEVFGEVSNARARLAGAATTEETVEADAALTSAVSRLLMIAENYPELKADTQFTALTDELSGTENRIAVARKDYNDAAKSYNTMIKRFPKVLIAKMFDFETAEYFKAAEGAEQVPQVKF